MVNYMSLADPRFAGSRSERTYRPRLDLLHHYPHAGGITLSRRLPAPTGVSLRGTAIPWDSCSLFPSPRLWTVPPIYRPVCAGSPPTSTCRSISLLASSMSSWPISAGLFRGLRFSDNLIAVACKPKARSEAPAASR
jgi:hypothetical protein